MKRKKTPQSTRIDAVVFVYGTLMSGFHNNVLMKSPNIKFLGNAKTVDNFMMFSNGYIPFVVNTPETQITGEAYHIKSSIDLDNLDRLEGHPFGYKRTPITILIDGQTEPIPAFIYIYQASESVLKKHEIHVQDGNFRKDPNTVAIAQRRRVAK